MKVELGLEPVAIVPPAPETTLQLPVPIAGVFPCNVVEVAQIFWSGPAFDTVGLAVRLITTSSVEDGQGAFTTVQRKV